MQIEKIARGIRLAVWAVSAVLAGAMRPMYFPSGGPSYVLVALCLVGVLFWLGFAIEKWLVRRHGR